MTSILLIEDDQDLADLMRDLLESERYTVELATDGVSGLERALSHEHDAVITDYSMPHRNGVALTRALAESGYPGPVLMCSGSPEAKAPFLTAGGDMFFSKPEEISALVDALSEL